MSEIGTDLETSSASQPRFVDGKAPGAMRTIGEVAQALGIAPHVLRYWEQQFPALRPLKRAGGRRYYRPEDVALVSAINRLVYREGYTLRGARLAIAAAHQTGIAASASVGAPPNHAPATAANITTRLHAIRDTLAAALAAT